MAVTLSDPSVTPVSHSDCRLYQARPGPGLRGSARLGISARAGRSGPSPPATPPTPASRCRPASRSPSLAGPGPPGRASLRPLRPGTLGLESSDTEASAGESEAARRLGLSNLKPLPGHSGSSEAQRLPMPVADDPSRTLSPYCCRHRHRGPRPPTRFMVRPA